MKLKYKKGYKYQLAEEYRFTIDLSDINVYDLEMACKKVDFISYCRKTNEFILDPGLACDGPSGPTKDDKTNIRAAFEHDALYKLMRLKILPQWFRKRADNKFNETAKEDRMWWWRRKYYLFFLKKYAGFAADPGNVKKVYTVGK